VKKPNFIFYQQKDNKVNKMRKILIIFGMLCVGALAGKYPSDLPQCRAGDTECLPRVITQIVQGNPNGHAGLAIPPLEPLHINKIDILQGGNNPISIELHFKHLDLYGLSKGIITKVVGFEADPTTSKYEVYATIPQLSVSGDYGINGRILVLPIQGEGKANLVFDNAKLVVKFKPKVIVKKGKEYVQTDKFNLDFDTEKLHIQLDNLFNGDKALGDNMNLFLNENWRDILTELKPAITIAVEEILKGIINRIFAKVPHQEAYLPN